MKVLSFNRRNGEITIKETEKPAGEIYPEAEFLRMLKEQSLPPVDDKPVLDIFDNGSVLGTLIPAEGGYTNE